MSAPEQLDLFSVDTRGMVRASDPETSRGAAVVAIGRKALGQGLALEALYRAGERGLTDFELAAVTGWQQTSIGKRRGELRDDGLVCAAFLLDPMSGDRVSVRRPSPTGTPAQVWELTPSGRDFYNNK